MQKKGNPFKGKSQDSVFKMLHSTLLLILKCWIQSRIMALDCASELFGHPQLIVWQLRQTSCTVN